MNIRYYFFLGLLFLPMIFTGQELIIRSVEALEDIHIEDMIQGESGELLILESHRLLTFDGYELSVVFETEVQFGHLKTFLQNEQEIYLGNTEGHLLIYKSGTIDTIKVVDGAAIKEIISASDNKFLISTDGAGVMIFDSDHHSIEPLTAQQELDHVNDMIYCEEIFFSQQIEVFTVFMIPLMDYKNSK